MCNFYQLPFLVLYVDATSFLQRHFGRKTGFSLSKGLSKLLDETSRASTDVSAVYSLIFSHFWSFEKAVSRSGIHWCLPQSPLGFSSFVPFMQESRTDMAKGFKLMRDRLTKPNFVHEYLLHLAIVYRVLRCVLALLMYIDVMSTYCICIHMCRSPMSF